MLRFENKNTWYLSKLHKRLKYILSSRCLLNNKTGKNNILVPASEVMYKEQQSKLPTPQKMKILYEPWQRGPQSRRRRLRAPCPRQ